jgi:hypothetical protein
MPPWLLQDCLLDLEPGGDVLAALDRAGVIDALVATLEHESPFCVAAAAGALAWVGYCKDGGPALMEASGAVPVLVRVVKRQIPARDLETEEPVFCRLGLTVDFQMVLCGKGRTLC